MTIRKIDSAGDAILVYGKFRRQILDVIEKSNDGISEHDLLTLIENREAIMWVNNDSLAIIQIVRDITDGSIWCLVRIACGNLQDIISGDKIIEEWAKKHAAVGIHLLGRNGWRRALRPLHYKTVLAPNYDPDFNKIHLSRRYLHWKLYDGIITQDDDRNEKY